MKPLVYLGEEEADELLGKKIDSIDFSRGTAFSLDDNTVFHVFSKSSKTTPAGVALDCFFKVYETPGLQIDIKSHFEKYILTQNGKKRISKAIIVFFAITENGKVISRAFFFDSKNLIECEVKYMPSKAELYSRHKGLIETDILRNKTVGIVGLGSGGSFIAIELAKAGVGKFILFDFDRIELSNISRHICGLNDIGRFKTAAVRDYILQKNPSSQITTYEININENLEYFSDAVKGANLIICASDTNSSRFNINQVSLTHKIIALYGRAISRAAGGDVLRVRPFIGPCLNCLFSSGLVFNEEEMSQMRQVQSEMPAYTTESEALNMIQVGLSSDIIPIANMVVKLGLLELSRGQESGISSLEEDLVADFYLWANRRERIYASWPKMEYGFNKQSILRWYGARIKRDENCMVCGEKNVTGDNIFA